MTKSQLLFIVANIWIAHSIEGNVLTLGLGIVYFIAYIIWGIFGK
jgi:hypothetical protein